MNKEQIQNLINQTLAEQSKTTQYSVSPVPFHTHNGTDSQRVFGMPKIIAGFAKLPGSSAPQNIVVTDNRITPTSVIVITTQIYQSGPAGVYSALCSQGYATIYSSTSGETSIINYIIILQ